MLNFKQRSLERELLDNNLVPFEDIRQNLIELNTINSLLGGHKITLDGIKSFIRNHNEPIIIVEIGCGGGDNLFVIENFLKKKKIEFQLIGIDIKQECIDYAQQQYPSIRFICSDYREAVLDTKPDIMFSSLFCHHFSNIELVSMLQYMYEHSKKGFFINDLERNRLAYFLIQFLTSIFSKSYLVKNDAPLSVARSFVKEDWINLFHMASISSYQISWKWAFRYLVIVKSSESL